MASECLGAVTKTKNTHALTARSNQLMAHVCYNNPHYALISTGRDTTSGTESMNMDESNGTNPKPLRPILFFKQAYENRLGTSTSAGLVA